MREKWSWWYRNWSRQLAAVSLADFFTLFIYLQVIGKGERGGGRGATDVCPLMHKKTSHAHFRLLLPSNDIICFRVKNFQLKNKQICYYSFVISLFLKTETTFFLFLREVNYLRRSKEGKKGASACRVGRLWLVRGKAVARSLSNNDGDDYENVTQKTEFALLQILSHLLHLVQFVKYWHIFLELNSKRLYQSSWKEKESLSLVLTSCTRREIRKFHIVVVQWRQWNLQKTVMHVQSCRFANLKVMLHGTIRNDDF